LTRLPPFNISAGLRYGFSGGRLRGLSLSVSSAYISDFVAHYEDGQRHSLEYPGYGITTFSASYSKRIGKWTHGVGFTVRNLFDTDLLDKLARLGAERNYTVSYRLTW
jgi:hypothetical protein